MVEKSGVEKFMVEKSGVEWSGLKLGVEKSGVEMSFNLWYGLDEILKTQDLRNLRWRQCPPTS